MKTLKYLSISVLLAAGLVSCGGDYLDTEDRKALEPDAVAEAAGRQPDIFLNGIWSWLVEFGGAGSTSHDDFGFMSVLLAGDCMTEDIAFTASHYFIYDYELDNRMWNYRRVYINWGTFYTAISKANEIINIYLMEVRLQTRRDFLDRLSQYVVCHTTTSCSSSPITSMRLETLLRMHRACRSCTPRLTATHWMKSPPSRDVTPSRTCSLSARRTSHARGAPRRRICAS